MNHHRSIIKSHERSISRLMILFSASVATCLGACSETQNNAPVIMPNAGTEMTSGTDMVAPCVSDSACAPGTVCDTGTGNCIPGQCSAMTPCPVNQMCDLPSLSCVSTMNTGCAADSDCGTGFCVAGMCQNVECVRDMNCATGQRCESMRCVTNTSCIDSDGDGFGTNCPAGPDCDDRNRNVNSGAPENGTTNCDDGIDNNCDGVDSVCGADLDLDNDGYADKDGDCNDMNPNVNPGVAEIYYNDIDDDCNPQTNDDDQDGDGFAAQSSNGPDCDDLNPNVNPRAQDIPGNGVDENCDGMDRVITNDDRDGDGVSEVEGDCDDDNPDVSPNEQEIPYNSLDDDCNSATPDNDLDRDGFSTPLDCDDGNALINPNVAEIYYNGVDDDCDPRTKDGDADGDGFNSTQVGGGDCNDDVASANPDGVEIAYNGLDDDCNPNTPDNDLDNDGFNRDQDCNDEDDNVNPDITENAEENCSDGIDNNCFGGDVVCDSNAVDTDRDGVPDNQDCEPNNPSIPGPDEIAGNGLDDDCDGQVDNACIDDAYDDANSNDSPVNAAVVGDSNNNESVLILCPSDVDWYQIELNAGDGLEVDLTFTHANGDIDLRLYRRNNGGLTESGLTVVDSSTSTTDNETVYTSRATVSDTYFIKVYQYGRNPSRLDYGMTVNVLTRCQDDPVSPSGEQNDTIAEASSMPDFGESRQICDYDDDWYYFSLSRQQSLRVDLMFTHAQGDLDLALHNANTTARIQVEGSLTDNEVLEVDSLPAGDYAVRVYGFGGAKNRYKIFRSSGTLQTSSFEDNDDYDIPDGATTPGIYTFPAIGFDNVPFGAVVSQLKLKQLDVNHRCVGDLEITLLWDGVPIKTLWNRDGENCLDGGLDDDNANPLSGCAAGVGAASWNFRLGNDVCFENRVYSEFAGLDAQGELTVEIKDYASDNTGSLVNLEFELDFFIP